MIIKRGLPEDVDWIYGQLPGFSELYNTKFGILGDVNEVKEKLLGLISHHLVYVAFYGGRRVGFIGGLVHSHLYNEKLKVLTQLLWWVVPSHRNTTAGIRLLDTFIAWGRVNAHWISLNLMQSTPVKKETLVKRGFVEKDRNYLLEVV